MTLSELREQCLKCEKCELSRTRHNVVFGIGNEHADIMFIGEGPGKNEDEQGEPFVGRAGALLDQFLAAFDIDRQEVYIANIVKCRPPENRDPLPQEQDGCIGWLERQIEIINPKIIVCLGRISARRIIDGNFLITKQHGLLFDINGRKYMGTFHPAALLRNPNNKNEAYRDFEVLAKLIGKV